MNTPVYPEPISPFQVLICVLVVLGVGYTFGWRECSAAHKNGQEA